MKIFAVVNGIGGTISNMVVGEDINEVIKIVGNVIEVTPETGAANIGWVWDGTVFVDPTPPVVEVTE